jgi:hypothetical protein
VIETKPYWKNSLVLISFDVLSGYSDILISRMYLFRSSGNKATGRDEEDKRED